MEMKVALDCRMKHGVETVVKNIVPDIAPEVQTLYLMGERKRFEAWWPEGIPGTVVPFAAPIYGLREQIEFPLREIRDCNLLHVPHFNIPVRRLPFPLLVTINDVGHLAGVLPMSWSYKQVAKFYYSHAVKRAAHLVTLSEFSKQEIIARLNVSPEKITVIPCGVDTRRFHRVSEEITQEVLARLHVQPPYLMISGSVRPHKNVGRMLLAFKELKQRHHIPHKLVVVGEREGFRINSTLPQLPDDVARDVVFTGYLPDADLVALYSGCEVFLFGSLYEGFGLPPLEAMACGAPVAVSHAASLPEVVGDAGVYFDPYSVDDIVNAVSTLLGDRQQRTLAAAASLERAATFNWKQRAKDYLRVYRNVVAQHG
jgi:glycosyltransferase involved in cell wall biosynthesis